VGQRPRAPIADIDRDGFAMMLGVNVEAHFLLARTVALHMIRNGYGRIIMLSSSADHQARAGDAAYIASKGAIKALTCVFACEWGRQGINTNAIAPGPFATETDAALAKDPKVRDIVRHTCPVGRWGDPKEISDACVFFGPPAASYVNGAVLTVDGSISIDPS
jgi:gluconate 5-dehydrogenase